ncbi:MAG: ATP-binding protein [Candidatus Humimicrobiaceae bacterium]
MNLKYPKTLKSKLFLFFTILLVILIGNSIWAAVNFSGLQESIENIMLENYKSIVAGQQMMIAIERQDSATLTYMFERSGEAVTAFKDNEVIFYKHLSRTEDNITEEGEIEIIESINTSYREYVQSFYNLAQSGGEINFNNSYYNQLFPLFESIKEDLRQLLAINQVSMVGLQKEAEATANKATYSILGVSVATIIIGILIAIYLSRKIINPINILIKKLKSISEKDYSQKLNISGNDEIAELSRVFNTMTEKLKFFEKLNIENIMKEKYKAEAIVESINDGIIVTDVDNNIILLNKAAERIFNIKEREATGKHFLESINNEEIFKVIDKVKEEPDNRESKKYTDFSIEKNGKSKHYRVNVTPIRGLKKEHIGIITLVQDITKLKKIDKMKSDFVSKVSHEFRTPLTSISMAVGLLLDKVPGKINKEQKELLEAIKQDETRLTKLVEELLDLSRIESGKIQMNLNPANIVDITAKAVKPLEIQADKKNVKVKIDKGKKMSKVQADFNKIAWVITNLVANAIRYSPSDGSGLVEIKFKEVGRKVITSVSDNGKGISEDFQKVIFEKFVQVKDKEQAEAGGAGLGLAISKEIINAHGGDIWVKSKLNKGSTFYFTLNKARKGKK